MGQVIKIEKDFLFFFNDLGKCFNYIIIHAKALQKFLTTLFFHCVNHRQCRHLLPNGILREFKFKLKKTKIILDVLRINNQCLKISFLFFLCRISVVIMKLLTRR